MLKNANIAMRLAVGFGVVVLLLVLMSVFTRIKMGSLAGLTTLLYEHPFTASTHLISAKTNIIKMQRDIRDVLLANNSTELNLAIKGLSEAEKALFQDLELVRTSYLGDPKDIDPIINDLKAWQPTRQKIIELMRAGKNEEAGDFHKNEGALEITKVEENLTVIEESAANRAASFVKDAKETASVTYLLIYLLVFVTVVASLIIATFISRSIVRPLHKAVGIANRISVGDLNMAMPEIERKDEVGELMQAFGRMIVYLREMTNVAEQIAGRNLNSQMRPQSTDDTLGNALATMINNLRIMIREIQESASVVASSVGEILATTTQLAAGIGETATSVSETTATVEEVKQTALLAAEKSQNVSTYAKEAVLVAEQGDTAVAETMDQITNVKGLMEIVAESVVMLSEQTQAIGDIITVVNDLAQQSNLLAVNAAIEASKAGEQGKGFTVVALEIKSLADQSKQATEQVRTILSDIQKATGKSVLAAEQVSKAVDGGVKQAAESGESIRKLAENINEASQAAAQIAASSQQQLAGMEQVAMAMESIKQASQQNVLGTKQAELAAHTLNELGRNLKEMIGTYKV
ncbi:MAG: methyl-accepting chemotaxis protein [Proteobacteria bacterium]|nr:methyl-accepting chemotaxis protein [Pseudomonadota bacterium]